MTVAEGIASILLWFINLGLACVLIFLCRRKYRVDALRHQLFVYRDELFDLALDSTVDFSDRAYVMLRESINTMLRYSHKVNLVRVLLVHYACRGPAFDELRKARDKEWEEAILALPSDQARDRIRTIRESFLLEVVKYTTFGWILWFCSVTASRFSGHPTGHSRKLVEKGTLVEIEARRAREARPDPDLMPTPA